MNKRENQYDDDDGRVICDMNLVAKPNQNHNNPPAQVTTQSMNYGERMSRAETWRYTWYSVLAGMLIVSVFAVTWVVFILFCTLVWFK